MSTSGAHAQHTTTAPAPRQTVVTLLLQLGVHHASRCQEADALRAWVRDNVPNRALRVSIRRSGYGFLLDQGFGRPLPR
jgi:hypothetical protein